MIVMMGKSFFLTVLVPLPSTVVDKDGVPITLLAYGSSIPLSISCLRRTSDAATIAKVVRTAPIPQEKTREV